MKQKYIETFNTKLSIDEQMKKFKEKEVKHNYKWKVHAQLENKRSFFERLLMISFWISISFITIIYFLIYPFYWIFDKIKMLVGVIGK